MLLPVAYYLVAFLIYVLLYEYYRNRARKFIAELDLLQNLESIPSNPIGVAHKK